MIIAIINIIHIYILRLKFGESLFFLQYIYIRVFEKGLVS